MDRGARNRDPAGRRRRRVNPTLRNLGRWLYGRAENVLAAMLAAMFVAFLLQKASNCQAFLLFVLHD